MREALQAQSQAVQVDAKALNERMETMQGDVKAVQGHVNLMSHRRSFLHTSHRVNVHRLCSSQHVLFTTSKPFQSDCARHL